MERYQAIGNKNSNEEVVAQGFLKLQNEDGKSKGPTQMELDRNQTGTRQEQKDTVRRQKEEQDVKCIDKWHIEIQSSRKPV